MEIITIQNNGLFIKSFNENIKNYESSEVTSDIKYHYNDIVEFGEDLTLEGLFNTLEPFVDILNDDFSADTRKWPLKPFFDSIKNDPKEKTEIKEVKFEWINECISYVDRKTGKQKSTLYNSLQMCGVGMNSKNEPEHYSLGFISLNDIKYAKLHAIKECSIEQYDSDTRERKIILEYEKDITLRELISTLLYEITFYGSPENMKQEEDHLKEMLKKSDEEFAQMIEENSFEKSTVIEDFQIEMLKDELQEALDEENFEWAKRVKEKIEQIQKELKE